MGAISGQIERSLIEDLGLPLDYLQIRAGEFSTGFSGTEVAVGKQVVILGTPTFIMVSPRWCRDQPLLDQSVGVSAEFRLSPGWLLAFSRDPVGTCAALGSQTAGTQPYQLGLDLLWTRTY